MIRDLFARGFVYEDRATAAIKAARDIWENVEDIVAAVEWGILHDPEIGRLLNERGIRGFVYPGARSRNEPDIDVLYECKDSEFVIHDLTFYDAKAHHAGKA